MKLFLIIASLFGALFVYGLANPIERFDTSKLSLDKYLSPSNVREIQRVLNAAFAPLSYVNQKLGELAFRALYGMAVDYNADSNGLGKSDDGLFDELYTTSFSIDQNQTQSSVVAD